MTLLPFFAYDVDYGYAAHIGLCTLWTPRKEYLPLRDAYGVCGNLYSRYGIGVLIRNVLACPAIQHIVVTGHENTEAAQQQGEALLHGTLTAADVFLEDEHIETFYARVMLHDARTIRVRNLDALRLRLADLHPLPPQYQAIHIPLPEPQQETYPTHRSGHLIRASSIADAHVRLLREIRMFGERTQPDSEGHERQELWQLQVCLASETTWQSIPPALYTVDEARRYGEALWNGDEPDSTTYRYGHTMRFRFGDQVDAVLRAFHRKPETYRTVISLWDPYHAIYLDDQPCLVMVHPRLRNGLLDMFAYLRTNEMFRGWPMNAAGLRHFQQRMAEELGVGMGELVTQSGSAHLYHYDLAAVDAYLEQAPRQVGITLDAKGDWRIFRQKGTLVAEHYQNGRLLQVLRAETTTQLERYITPFLSDIGHAIHIGRMLASYE